VATSRLVIIGVIVVAASIAVGLVISTALKGSSTPPGSTAAVIASQEALVNQAAAQFTDELLSGSEGSKGFSDALDSAGWSAYKKASRHITYPVLNKDASSLVGKHFKIKGQVFQIDDAGPGMYVSGLPDGIEPQTLMQLSMTNDGYGFWSDEVAVAYAGTLPKVYERNIVTVYGVCAGQYNYTSVAGYEMTVPLIVARYVTKP